VDIEKNIKLHNKIAKKYEKTHGEIYNNIEQSRLVVDLHQSLSFVKKEQVTALDLGCGAGNLTNHLLNMGCNVIAADVSTGFLRLVEKKFQGRNVSTFELNGKDLKGIEDNTIDFIATYSVLHHIPDYIKTIKEMCRICSPGGVIYIDHEQNNEYWSDNKEYKEFQSIVNKLNLSKFFVLSNYIGKIKRIFNPKYANEGDIHVWPDDHIEWDLIDDVIAAAGFKKILQNDFLLYNNNYKKEVYDKYKDKCTDMRVAAYRKNF
jgi:ubiquinone/menaquinone biosynthesis C-methylase UbiE|tara:strand:- start:1436 stop:2221 length:786 start_codon:yes stop_codon:yes gene_type:complete